MTLVVSHRILLVLLLPLLLHMQQLQVTWSFSLGSSFSNVPFNGISTLNPQFAYEPAFCSLRKARHATTTTRVRTSSISFTKLFQSSDEPAIQNETISTGTLLLETEETPQSTPQQQPFYATTTTTSTSYSPTTTEPIVPISNDMMSMDTTTAYLEHDNVLVQRLQQYLGMPITLDLAAIVTIYFVEGALGLAVLAKSYLLKDELHLGPAEMSALTGFFVLPWTIKPLYGFLSDGFPLFGYRRKSYLIAAGLVGALSYGVLGIESFWTGLNDPTLALAGTVVALLLSSACIAFSDVVADGIVVAKTRESDDPAVAGGLQSLCWGASATGSLLSAYFSGSLLQVLTVRNIFGITAVLPLLVAAIAFFMPEKKIESRISSDMNGNEEEATNDIATIVQEQTSTLWEAFKQDSIWKPALFLFLWQSTPTADGAFFFFLNDELGLGPEFMGRVRLVTSLATLVGVALYNTYFKTVPIKSILKWSAIASFPLGMIPVLLTTHYNQVLGIPDQWLIYGDDVVLAMLGEIAFLPCLVLAARLCPPGVEAVLFATLMSIFNGASTVGTEIGAALTKGFGITETEFGNLTWLLIFCNVTSLYPLFFLGFLDKIGDKSESELEQEEQPPETAESK